MNSLLDCLAEGEARKRAAHTLIEAQREALVLRGRRAMLSHLLAHGTATTDDVRAAVPIPPGVNPKLFGAVPGLLAARRIIRSAGSRKTTRAAAHARWVTLWELADRAAAVAWLAANPEPPDPAPPLDPADPFAC